MISYDLRRARRGLRAATASSSRVSWTSNLDRMCVLARGGL